MTLSRPIHASHGAALALLGLLLALGGCRTAPLPDHEIAPTTDTRRAIASLALEQLGAPYQSGAAGSQRFDDSGLAYFSYRGAGADLPRATPAQLNAGKPIDLAAAQPADLLFFRVEDAGDGDRLVVGLYVQPREMLMAVPNVRGQSGVTLVNPDDVFWRQRMVGVIRVLSGASRP